MDHIKELIKIPSDELRANVQVCLEHSCAIFLGNYGLCKRDEEYVKDVMNMEKGEPNKSDLEFKTALDIFKTKMNAMQSIWHSIGPVKMGVSSSQQSLSSVLLGIIQAFEMSEVPPIIPAVLEALVTGQWKNFVLSAAGLMSPSGMKIEVIHEIVTYLIGEDFWEWCKRHIVDEGCESFNLYTNQTMEPLEELLGEAPET